MSFAGVQTRPITDGGTQLGGRVWRWPRAAVVRRAALVSAAVALVGCSSFGRPAGAGVEAEYARRMGAGHRLYHEGEYAIAGRRFSEAAQYAHTHRQRNAEKRATVAECVSWLRARAVPEFDTCTHRLDDLHQRAHRSERGIGTLLALGAIAGDRPPPGYRVPSDIGPVLDKAAKAGGER